MLAPEESSYHETPNKYYKLYPGNGEFDFCPAASKG